MSATFAFILIRLCYNITLKVETIATNRFTIDHGIVDISSIIHQGQCGDCHFGPYSQRDFKSILTKDDFNDFFLIGDKIDP